MPQRALHRSECQQWGPLLPALEHAPPAAESDIIIVRSPSLFCRLSLRQYVARMACCREFSPQSCKRTNSKTSRELFRRSAATCAVRELPGHEATLCRRSHFRREGFRALDRLTGAFRGYSLVCCARERAGRHYRPRRISGDSMAKTMTR